MYHTDFSWKTYALVSSFLVAAACVLAPGLASAGLPTDALRPRVKRYARYSAMSDSNNLSM